jgi:hypothetical protein
MLSHEAPELRELRGYSERGWTEEDWTVARWTVNDREFSVVHDPTLAAAVLCLERAPVLRADTVEELLEGVRLMCALGPPMIVASSGPCAYRATILFPQMGYRHVDWFAWEEDGDGLRESGLSAAELAWGGGARGAICVSAQAIGDAGMA